MDFQSLSRRDLQFFCKRNKIPANITNIAMVDALKALEIVEGIEEFMNQSDLSPTSVAKNLPSAARTAARTTRRKAKDETEPPELVTRSCYVASKSLAGEMEQENRNSNVLGIPSVPQSRKSVAAASVAKKLEVTDVMHEANVSKTPAARSTRRTQVAASSKKEETVQRVYSTRRSVKLLEESMADLSLKTKESINVPAKKNEDSPAGSESEEKTEKAEVISMRDLSDSLEKEWDGMKNDPDVDVLYGDLGDITFSDANTTKEQMNGKESKTSSPTDSFVLVEDQEKRQEDGFVVVNHAASTTTNIVACNKESEPEEMKIDSEPESDETEYETDPGEEDEESAVAVDSNQEAIGSKVPGSENESKVDSVTTAPIAEESKEVESDNDSEESETEEEEMSETDNESEVALVSDKMKTQASPFSPLGKKEANSDSDEWSDYEIEDINEVELALVADNNKNKENVEEMVVNNNGESKAEGEVKKKNKKKIDEESLKDVSMRQLTKLVKELAIKSKQHTST